MQVANNMAVSIHYTLTNDEGEVIDSSAGGDALTYLHGQGNIISGLENALLGKTAGDKFKVRIEADEAYGEFDEDAVYVIQREMISGIEELEVGMMLSSGQGEVTIIDIVGNDVTIDGNHPLAGVALTFDVEVVGMRSATADELAHGHIHGAGCHHH